MPNLSIHTSPEEAAETLDIDVRMSLHSSTSRPLTWLLRLVHSSLEVIAGPFPSEHELEIENALLAVLAEGWDPEETILFLSRDSSGEVDLESLDEDYLDWCLDELVKEGAEVIDLTPLPEQDDDTR